MMGRRGTPAPDRDPDWSPLEPGTWAGDAPAATDDAPYVSQSEKEKSAAAGERFARIATNALLGAVIVLIVAVVFVVGLKTIIWIAAW